MLVAVKHRQLQMRLFVANAEVEEAIGTPGQFDALCRFSKAERELEEYEAKLDRLRELQAEVRRRRTEPGWVSPAAPPAIVRLAKLQRRAAELERWRPRAG